MEPIPKPDYSSKPWSPLYKRHPEDVCYRCAGVNPSWSVDSDRWNASVAALGEPRSVILCPGCFVIGHELATGLKSSWKLTPEVFRHA